MSETKEIRNPVKAIRANCLDCMGGSSNEVKLCPVSYCPLFPFRFGKNPYRRSEITEEQRKIKSERMKKLREQQLAQNAKQSG